MKILAFGTSNSAQSINRTLAVYTANLVPDARVEVVDLRDFELPLFSIELEEALGQPAPAREFFDKIAAADAIVISFAEHNGSYTAVYKNLFDWTSRIDKAVYQHKPSVFLATSPGAGGAASVLASAVDSAKYFGADLAAAISVPRFHENLDVNAELIRDPEIQHALTEAANKLQEKARTARQQDNLSPTT